MTTKTLPKQQELEAKFQKLRQASIEQEVFTYKQRITHLNQLAQAIIDRQDDLIAAIQNDFVSRPTNEILLSELVTTISTIRYVKKNLSRWMQPQRRHVDVLFQPAKVKVHLQPKGVVGIIAPWNYPFNLAMIPFVYALAAGNRIMIKPSEVTSKTAQAIKELIADLYADDHATVIAGTPGMGSLFSRLPFDHLFFTGSTTVGKQVMQAASENLTPVTLELGGKSPAIIHPSYSLEYAAGRVLFGKLFNGGQTCIAPDYLLLHKDKINEFVELAQKIVRQYYPTIATNPDYTAVINQEQHERLLGYLQEAQQLGAKVISINPRHEEIPSDVRKIFPTLVLAANKNMKLLQEEIFGPILPIIAYETLEEAIDYINQGPRPLALYYFDHNRDRIAKVLTRTTSGGACVNEVLAHFIMEDAPFGGIGHSGMGNYHGPEGFETFSHKKTVFYQSRINGVKLLNPPHKSATEKALRLLLKR